MSRWKEGLLGALWVILVALIAVSLWGCGDPIDYCSAEVSSTVIHIVGGMPSEDRRATAVVRRNGKRICTGTVLDEHNVVTAAHCIYAGEYSVRVGDEEFLAWALTIHPDYVKYPLDDLAILHTTEPMPGPYPTTAYDPADSRSCLGLVAQGYGFDSEGVAGELREAPYEVLGVSGKTLLTAGVTYGDGTCYGDSGGPLYALVGSELQLAGVNSTGFSSDCRSGGQHVNALHYWPWLMENLR
jgi:hypothetical protein